ncbi:MAG: PH domain-containing protein [Nocardioides sp.]
MVVFRTARLHSPFGKALAALTFAVVAVLLAEMLLRGQWPDLIAYSGPLGMVVLVAWAVWWSPYVEYSPAGVRLHNVVRSVFVPWPAIESIDPRYGLTLGTPFGRFSAWAATRPSFGSSRRVPPAGRLGHRETSAADAVTEVRDALVAAGHLDQPRLESDRADIAWRHDVVAAALGLAAWSALARLLVS